MLVNQSQKVLRLNAKIQIEVKLKLNFEFKRLAFRIEV